MAVGVAIAAVMLAACASSAPRDSGDAAAKRASETRAEREAERCRLAEAQGRSDPRCPAARPRPSRNPNLPLELPVGLPGGLL